MASLVISTIALANSIMFESVYAVDNCDPSTNCQNFQTGTGNKKNNYFNSVGEI
jgi:hypothetical protein